MAPRLLARCCVTTFLLMSPFFVYFNAMNWCLPSKSAVNRYEAATIRPGYRIVPPFSFPFPEIMKSVDEIAAMKWVRDLAENLARHRTSKQVYLQVVNEKYYELFLNLLVAFKKEYNDGLGEDTGGSN